MVLSVPKIPSIGLIFDKDKKGNYTFKALLYQDIVRYCLVLLERGQDSVRIWDLTSWLLNNNKEFANSKSDLSERNQSRSNRIEDRMDRVKRSVVSLCWLQVMDEFPSVKQSKGEGPVKIYGYTFSGFLLSWIMRSTDPAERQHCENQIYDLWQLKLEHNSPVDKFTSNIFKKYKENGVFGIFVVDRIREFLYSGSHIETMKDVVESISVVHTKDMKTAELFIELWQETWDELDHESRQKLLHHFKSAIELNMSSRAYSPEDYEEHRFALRNNLEVLALEAFCRHCGTYNYAVVPLVPYLRRKKIPRSGPKIVKCAECNEQSVEIPNL